MKKNFLIILCLLVLTTTSIMAEDSVVENPIIENSEVEDLVPTNIVYPYVSITSLERIDENIAIELILKELQDNKIGNPLTPLKFHQLKVKTIENTKINQSDLVTLKCAEINKGYYLKISLTVGSMFDKNIFELYNPQTSELICRVETVSSLGFVASTNKVLKNTIKSGIKKLSNELKEIKPELIIELYE